MSLTIKLDNGYIAELAKVGLEAFKTFTPIGWGENTWVKEPSDAESEKSLLRMRSMDPIHNRFVKPVSECEKFIDFSKEHGKKFRVTEHKAGGVSTWDYSAE